MDRRFHIGSIPASGSIRSEYLHRESVDTRGCCVGMLMWFYTAWPLVVLLAVVALPSEANWPSFPSESAAKAAPIFGCRHSMSPFHGFRYFPNSPMSYDSCIQTATDWVNEEVSKFKLTYTDVTCVHPFQVYFNCYRNPGFIYDPYPRQVPVDSYICEGFYFSYCHGYSPGGFVRKGFNAGIGNPDCSHESCPAVQFIVPRAQDCNITLSNISGIQQSGYLADVEPARTVNTLKAHVRCNGQPVSGKAVGLNVEAVPFSGGHQHNHGPQSRPNGTVSFNGGDTTDANGDVAFTFTAPAPAGDHTLTAQCSDGSCGTTTGSVWVGVKDLRPIGPGPWTLTGSKPDHPDNHYLTTPAFLVLQQLGLHWRRLYVPFGPVFGVNDASLARGGLFDCCETYTDRFGVFHNRQIEGWWTPPHSEHRRGTVVDINGIRRADEREFERYVREELRGDAQIHGAGTGRHYHVRLMGRIE